VNLAYVQINLHTLHDCTEELRFARKPRRAARKRLTARASTFRVGGGTLLVDALHDTHKRPTLALPMATGLGATARTSTLSMEGHTLLLWLLLHALHGAVGRSEELLALRTATTLLVPLVRPKRAPTLAIDRCAPQTRSCCRHAGGVKTCWVLGRTCPGVIAVAVGQVFLLPGFAQSPMLVLAPPFRLIAIGRSVADNPFANGSVVLEATLRVACRRGASSCRPVTPSRLTEDILANGTIGTPAAMCWTMRPLLLLDALHGAIGRSEKLLALGAATAVLVPLVRPKRTPALAIDRRAPQTRGFLRQAS